MITILLFLIILSLLVLVHEFGHFVVARRVGMKVYEFGFGFPPRAFGVYRDPKSGKWIFVRSSTAKAGQAEFSVRSQQSRLANVIGGEEKEEEYPSTVYSVNWLPLGGFVKVKGENGEQAHEPDSFGYHPFWKKASVLVAGVFMNVLLAAVVLAVGFSIGIPTDLSDEIDPEAIIVEPASVMIQQVDHDSPADKAGLVQGDRILSIAGEPVTNTASVIATIQEFGDQSFVLVRDRFGEEQEITVTPKILEGESVPRIGVALADAGIIRYPWYRAIGKGCVAAGIGFVNILVALFFLVKQLILGQGLLFDVSGPVGIAVVVGQSAKLGIHYLLNVVAMLSLSLAVINILPIPALDGGRLLFVTIEKIFGRPVPMKYEQAAHTIGFVLLMLLIVVVTWRDIARVF